MEQRDAGCLGRGKASLQRRRAIHAIDNHHLPTAEQGRAALDPIIVRNPNLKVSAKVASNHSKILRNGSPAVAAAIRELAPVTNHPVR